MFKIGDKVKCIRIPEMCDSLLNLTDVYTIQGIDLDGDVYIAETDDGWWRANRFTLYRPHIYTRGSTYELSTPVHTKVPESSNLDEGDRASIPISSGGIGVDTHLHGLRTRTSLASRQPSAALNSTIARHWEVLCEAAPSLGSDETFLSRTRGPIDDTSSGHTSSYSSTATAIRAAQHLIDHLSSRSEYQSIVFDSLSSYVPQSRPAREDHRPRQSGLRSSQFRHPFDQPYSHRNTTSRSALFS